MRKGFAQKGVALGGFTLIELMVSVAIFTVVMTVALGALLSISAAERKAETIKTVMDNLDFAMEGMSRTIRTGINYDCGVDTGTPTNCTSGGTELSLTASDSSRVTYCWGVITSGTPSCVSSGGNTILRKINSGPFLALTAPEINISTFALYVNGAPLGDSTQPRVVMTLSGSASISAVASTTFRLQTTVTQRIYDQ